MGGRDHPDVLLFTEENQWTLGTADYEWTWLAVARLHLSAVCTFEGGGKGVLTISQAATGKENGLTLRVYDEKGAIKWATRLQTILNSIVMASRGRHLLAARGIFLKRRS